MFYLIYRFDYETNQEYFHSVYVDRDCALIAEKLLMNQDKNASYKIETKSWIDLFEVSHYVKFNGEWLPTQHALKEVDL